MLPVALVSLSVSMPQRTSSKAYVPPYPSRDMRILSHVRVGALTRHGAVERPAVLAGSTTGFSGIVIVVR